MIKTMLLVSACAFAASVGFFGLAAVSASAHGVSYANFKDSAVSGDGPTVSRDLVWPGGDTVRINLPADVHYVQGPVASLRLTGPQGTVQHVVLEDDTLKFEPRVLRPGRVEVAMTAPDVTRFILAGSQTVDIVAYNHPTLELTIAGSGQIKAAGAADRAEAKIAGSGDIDLAALASRETEINIAGSGKATIAPTELADVHVAGSGDVILKSRPARVKSHFAGSGRIVQAAP